MTSAATSLLLLLGCGFVSLGGAASQSQLQLFNLTILHTNDVHCRFEQTNKHGGTCSDEDAAAGKFLFFDSVEIF